jgi:hypothetical protein
MPVICAYWRFHNFHAEGRNEGEDNLVKGIDVRAMIWLSKM